MKEYGMVTKTGEIVYKVKTNDIAEAIKHFSFLKQMNVNSLLELFDIKELKN